MISLRLCGNKWDNELLSIIHELRWVTKVSVPINIIIIIIIIIDQHVLLRSKHKDVGSHLELYRSGLSLLGETLLSLSGETPVRAK